MNESRQTPLANNIKRLRKESNLTQKQLASKLGISYGALANYEMGFREPNSKAMVALESFFNVSGAYLRGETNDRGGSHNETDPLILNLVLGKVNRVMKHYQSDLLKSDNDRQQTANFLLDSWVNIIIKSVLQNDDLEDPHFYMKVAESLNSLNSDGFLEVCKRINELSRLDEYKSTQK